MTINNRTSEFHSCIESLRSRANGEGAMMASQLMHRLNAGSRSEEQSLLERRPKTRESKSDFGRMASNVGREIALTASKLDKLTKRKSVYCILISIHFSRQEKVIV